MGPWNFSAVTLIWGEEALLPSGKSKVAKALAEKDEGPERSPEPWASLPAESWGTQSAVRKLKRSQQSHPSGLPHNNRYLLWMPAVPTIHT